MTSQRPQRRSARVFLLDQRDRVLLLKFVVPRGGSDHHFWATPGGGVEPYETALEAANRELAEELEIVVALNGPVHEVSSTFEHEGVLTDNTDVFFFGRCSHDAPRLSGLTDAERRALADMRWWSVDEIDAAEDTIYPPDLSMVVRRLLGAPDRATSSFLQG